MLLKLEKAYVPHPGWGLHDSAFHCLNVYDLAFLYSNTMILIVLTLLVSRPTTLNVLADVFIKSTTLNCFTSFYFKARVLPALTIFVKTATDHGLTFL